MSSPSVLVGLLQAIDMVLIFALGVAAYWIRHGFVDVPGRYWLAILVCMLLALQLFHIGKLYSFALLDHLSPQIARLLPLWAVVGLILIALIFFTKRAEDFSRIWAALWLSSSFIGFLAARIWLKLQLRRWRAAGLLTRTIALVGAGEHGARLVRHLRSQPDSAGLHLVGIYDDRRTRLPEGGIEGISVSGTVDDLIARIRRDPVDLVVIALPWNADARLVDLMTKLRQVPVDVQLCPESIGFRLVDRRVTHLARVPMLTVFERPLSGWNVIIKDLEDRLLAALILALVSPLMLLIALAIRLGSPGPVLFRQRRFGFNNNLITVLKFRTMHDRPPEAGSDLAQARRDDPRITRIGAWLRRTSLDELPQFFNVLRGEMSIVGPRPHAVAHNESFATVINEYYSRHRVKPGITGWAQIHGLRGETDTQEKLARRVEFDLYYIDNWSLYLDLKIILLTLFLGFMHENAY